MYLSFDFLLKNINRGGSMKFFKFSLFLVLVFSSFACTNSSILGKKGGTEKQFQTIIETSVNPEEELYSIGGFKIEESGIKVARMKAVEEANELLNEKVKKESHKLLQNFSGNADIYEKKLNKHIIESLSEYVAKKVLQDVTPKKEWEYDTGEIFVLISVAKEDVVDETKNIFVEHLDKVLSDLKKVRQEISSYEVGDKKPVDTAANLVENTADSKVGNEEINFDI